MRKEIIIQDEELKVHILGEYLEKDKNAVAIVGTRRMTQRGKDLAHDFSFELAKKGVTIISGLAVGIDTAAHNAALEANGRTIAVLAHGIDRIYPKENSALANKIMKNGCLITAFETGTRPLPKNFLARNQLIAGLSKAVLIIEGKKRSGTLSTAAHAARMGIDVYAIPGSDASDFLINEGAIAVNSPKELLNFLNIS
ncbi:MAG TPA: DNA-processing protein DprA [Candidatus Saccharimonadales bacterium]|nr:DNA-processing protein DprA [Candidatus Saccharimonadales bacterium]